MPMRFPLPLSACADAIHQESLAVGCPPYVADACSAPTVGVLADATVRRAVVHLTNTDTFHANFCCCVVVFVWLLIL
ncbi:MAG: hypothetical protein LBQ66_13840 [Planctomycetaceae bacterium]|nr:hypothetical protein [Planctomycetaceae bacterium]